MNLTKKQLTDLIQWVWKEATDSQLYCDIDKVDAESMLHKWVESNEEFMNEDELMKLLRC